MRIRIANLAIAIAMILAGARAARAQESDRAVTATLLKFADALEAGEPKALERLIYADSYAQERARTAFVQLAAAQKSLERAALARFGEEDGKRFRCGFDLIATSSDRKAISSAKVGYDEGGRLAHVEKPGELLPMFLRRGPGGQWQVILDVIEEIDEAERNEPPRPFPTFGRGRWETDRSIRLGKSKAFAEAFEQTRARIEGGQLASADAAQSELIAKMTAASADAAAKTRAAAVERRGPSRN